LAKSIYIFLVIVYLKRRDGMCVCVIESIV